MDIKNTVEVLEAVELVGLAIKEIKKDGIAIDDLPKALELVKKYELILAAVDSVELVVDEVKDIDSVEAVIIVTKLMSIIKNLKA